MSMFSNTLFLFTFFLAHSSFANLFDFRNGLPLKTENFFAPNEVPQLSPVVLLRANNINGAVAYVLLSRDERGNTYVLVRDRFGVRVPKITNRSTSYYDSGLVAGGRGTLDLYFEMGGRLLVPSNQKQNYLNATQGATLYSEDTAPISFTEIKDFNRSKLNALGFQKLMAPEKKATNANSEPNPEALTTQAGSKFSMLEVFNASDDLRTNYSSRRAVRQFGEKIDSSKAAFLDTNVVGSELHGYSDPLFLVKRESVDDLNESIRKLNAGDVREINYSAIRKALEDGPTLIKMEVAEALRTLTLGQETARVRLEALAQSVIVLSNQDAAFWSRVKKGKAQSDVIQILRQIATVLGKIEKIHLALQIQMQYDARLEQKEFVWSSDVLEQVKSNPLQTEMARPLELIGEKLLTILDRFQHPEAQKIIFIGSTIMNGIGHRLLGQKASGSKKTYSQLYFDYLRNAEKAGLESIRKAEYLNREGGAIRIESNGGGVFQNVFGSVNGELVATKDYSPGQAIYLDKWILSPLVDLGRNDRRAKVIQDVLQTVIELDKNSEFLAQWKRIKDKLYELQRFGLDRAAGLEYLAQGYLSQPTIERLKPDFERAFGVLREGVTLNQIIRKNLNDESLNEKIYGSSRVFSLLVNLGFGWWQGGETYPGFSQMSFHKSAVEIFTKLMESSSISIINEGTYISILEGAINLSRYLQSHEELVDMELARGLRLMNSEIQNQLLRGFHPKVAVERSTNRSAVPKHVFDAQRPALYFCAHLFSSR